MDLKENCEAIMHTHGKEFEEALSLARKVSWDRKRNLTAYETTIMDKTAEIVIHRFFDLFTTFVEWSIPDDKARALFLFQFLKLTRDMREHTAKVTKNDGGPLP